MRRTLALGLGMLIVMSCTEPKSGENPGKSREHDATLGHDCFKVLLTEGVPWNSAGPLLEWVRPHAGLLPEDKSNLVVRLNMYDEGVAAIHVSRKGRRGLSTHLLTIELVAGRVTSFR